MTELVRNKLFEQIAILLDMARQKVMTTVNHTMVQTYFEIGRMIVEDELQGNERAKYAQSQLKGLSEKLTEQFGKGFSVSNLKNMRQFYLTYSEQSQFLEKEFAKLEPIRQTVSSELIKKDTEKQTFPLSWSHYQKLIRISDPYERRFYEIEAEKNHWSLRELERQYDSALFTRLALSKNKDEIRALALEGQKIEKPADLVKDPYILEFLGLSEMPSYSENELEQHLIDKLEHFLLELGSGFAFVGRQKRISFDEQHFYIDLVFYNRLLRCFVLIDLKIGKLKHQDIGQMQMYVNYYDREMRLEGENQTIGLILCQDKTESLVKYTLPEDNDQIFASKYQTALPSKEALLALLQE
ncbi:YhcG family protein [Mannheimia sp. E30BD]|uniref:PDDEXK nuclease domain-containing protein n=2 Tax=Mannheimia TaxID=75984 RepID=UPI00359E215B